MADDEQNQQPPRYWFPYWSGVPQPPPASRSSRPPVRPQQSRRLSPPSPSVAPSSPRRPSPSPQHRQQPTTTTATRGPAPPTPSQSQAARPSPSRTSPLAPIRAPAPPSNNSNAVVAATPVAPAKLPAMPVVLLAVPEAAPRQKDVDVVIPPVKPVPQVQQPAAAAETKPNGGHGKAADKELKAHHHKEEKEMKDEHKSKDKQKEKDHKEKKDETKSKEKEKDHKEKEKKHHAGEDGKHKEAKVEHGKLHREIKAGVADMVHKASGAAASRSGHGHGHERGATSVITLAGENKGASMKVGGGKSKDGGEWHGHGHRLDGGSGSDGKKAAGKAGMMTALINSNVQVINNSLLLQSSCNGGDPGVHLKLSAKSASKEKQKHAGGGDKAAADGKK